MDVVVVRKCRQGGYVLLDESGKYVGGALTLRHAYRFAKAARVPISFARDTVPREEAVIKPSGGWLDRLRALATGSFCSTPKLAVATRAIHGMDEDTRESKRGAEEGQSCLTW